MVFLVTVFETSAMDKEPSLSKVAKCCEMIPVAAMSNLLFPCNAKYANKW